MCEIDFDGDYCTVFEETAVRARKYHRCKVCSKRIRPRSFYVRHFSLFDGEPEREAICQLCWFLREEFGAAHRIRLVPSSFWEYLTECIVGEEDEGEPVDPRWRRAVNAIHRRRRKARVAA